MVLIVIVACRKPRFDQKIAQEKNNFNWNYQVKMDLPAAVSMLVSEVTLYLIGLIAAFAE